jgi:hypothetical protein
VLLEPSGRPIVKLELGVRLHLRGVATIDDFGTVHAPAWSSKSHPVATVDDVYRVEAVLLRVLRPGVRARIGLAAAQP